MKSPFLDEDIAQLEFELERSAARTDAGARQHVAEALLSLRVGWLLATKEQAEPCAPFVSELELRYFLDATRAAEKLEAPVAQLLRPAVGVSRSTAEAFCAWLTRWAAAEVTSLRLPTVAEARRPAGTDLLSPSLGRLSAETQVGAWCSDGFVSLPMLPLLDRTARGLDRLLRFDAYFLFRNGILHLGEKRMPVRTDDLDFNVHYEKDRLYVENYAAGLKAARDALRGWDEATGSRLGLARRLDFNPFENLGGMSPLDSQRNAIVDAYRTVRRQVFECCEEGEPGVPTLAEMAFEYFAPREANRLALACARQVERGVDRASLLPRLRGLLRDETNHGKLPPSSRLEGLETALLEDLALEPTQWLALDAWYGSDMRRTGDAEEWSWWRRLFGPEPPRPRDVLASIYADLAVLDERERGRLQAFEGIRLVRDA